MALGCRNWRTRRVGARIARPNGGEPPWLNGPDTNQGRRSGAAASDANIGAATTISG